MSKKKKTLEPPKSKDVPRNEFHAYLQRTGANQCYIQKNKKREIPRKAKYKESYDR